MIDPFELLESLCGSVNTHQGGHVRPQRNFIQWCNDISDELFEQKFENWGKSQKIKDHLSQPFLKSIAIQVKDVPGSDSGLIHYPKDYAHFSSARFYTYNNKPAPFPELPIHDFCGNPVNDHLPDFIEEDVMEVIRSMEEAARRKEKVSNDLLVEHPVDLIDNGRWGSVINHRFDKPTADAPKITQTDEGFKVAPAGVGVIVLDYLRKPIPATFEYTVAPGNPRTGEGDYIVYDKEKSKPLEWSSLIKHEFLIRLEKKYGKLIRESFIWQTSESDRKNA